MTLNALAQGKSHKVHIQEVGLKDSIGHHIQYFIDSVSQRDEGFRNGKGYLWLIMYEDQGGNSAPDSLAIRHYELRKNEYDYDDDDSHFPLFYTLFNGRPILIETRDVSSPEYFLNYRISQRSKRKFRRLLEPFLPPKEKVPDAIRKQGKRPYRPRWWRAESVSLCHCYFKITVFYEGTSQAKYMEEEL